MTATTQNLEHITLVAPDISCGHCVATVEGALGKLDGVTSVSANADTKKVVLDFDASILSLGQIEAVLADEGYPVQH